MPYELELTTRSNSNNSKCSDLLSYHPDTLHPESDITYTISMIFHIIEGPLAKSNFNLLEGTTYFSNMINNCNYRLSLNEHMKLPIGNKTSVFDSKIRFEIGNKNLTGILPFYHHTVKDTAQAYFLNKGLAQNNYNTDIFTNYSIRDDSLLNVYIMSFPPKLIKNNPKEYHGSGIALGSNIKMGGMYQKGGPDWGYATMFTHEVGHVLNLGHAWVQDGCDDTPIHPNCFGDGVGPCSDGSIASNNLMDYNNNQMAITPCQISKMRNALAKKGNFQRKLLKYDFCETSTRPDIEITKKVIWSGEKDLDRSILIKKGGSLQICCRLSLPQNGYIKVEKGGELRLESASIENACGYLIKGILKEKGAKIIEL